MSEDKKQKVLIGVLAVLAIGAGSYYFVFRDTSGGVVESKSDSGGAPRVRESALQAEQAKTNPRTRAAANEEAEARPEARERERPEPESRTETRRRPSGPAKKVKKSTAPAA